jgi:hypothetical protein
MQNFGCLLLQWYSRLLQNFHSNIKLPADGGCLLSRLVSSACCPRLHKLRLVSFKLSMKEKLLIEAATLLELLLERTYGVQFLELRTPSLRVIHVEKCSELNEFTVLAPRLEDLMFWVQQPLHIDDVHGHLSSVGTLKIQLFSHGMASYDINSSSIHLVQCCRLTRCLEVSFRVVEVCRMHHMKMPVSSFICLIHHAL